MLARAVPGFTPIAVVVAMIVVAGIARHNAAVPRHMCAHIGPVIRAVVRVIPAVGPVAAVGRPFRRHDHAPEQGGRRLVHHAAAGWGCRCGLAAEQSIMFTVWRYFTTAPS